MTSDARHRPLNQNQHQDSSSIRSQYSPQQQEQVDDVRSNISMSDNNYCYSTHPDCPRRIAMISTIQHLNNRACVLIAMKNFSKANTMLETALVMHKQMAAVAGESSSSSSCSCCCANSRDPTISSDYYCDDNNMLMYDSDSDLDSDEDADSDSDWDEEGDECFNYDGGSECSKRTGTETSFYSTNYNQEHSDNTNNIKNERLRRMTSCSRVRTFSYTGQQDKLRSARTMDRMMYHQVYSLPIVASQSEWEDAAIDDRSFVLIFNSALCNHLWGMQLLSHNMHTQNLHQQRDHRLIYQRSFEIAKVLYELALENVSRSCRRPQQRSNDSDTGGGIMGVDRVCFSAVFNNVSHVCKVLGGYNNCEVYKYDNLLIKSIYWLIDSNPNIQNNITFHNDDTNNRSNSDNNSNSQHHYSDSATTLDANQNRQLLRSNASSNSNYNPTTAAASSNNSRDYDEHYDESEAEIIDAFLENVFYLVGVPQAIVPAAAA